MKQHRGSDHGSHGSGESLGGFFWLAAGALAGLGALFVLRNRDRLRPFAVRLLKDAYGFGDWVVTNASSLWEEAEDLSHEAKGLERREVERRLAALDEERALLARLAERMRKAPEEAGHE